MKFSLSTPESLHGLKRGLIAALLIGTCFSLFQNSNTGDKIDSYLAHRLNFAVREYLQLQPRIDSHLKIFAIDDSSAAYLKSPEMPFERWEQILTAIGERQPRAIYIDKIFGLAQADDRKEAMGTVARVPAPVYVGGFTTSERIFGRWQYPFEENLRNHISNFQMDGEGQADIDRIPWLKIEKMYVYGPEKDYLGAFAGVGILDYALDGYIRPVRRPDSEHILQYLAFASSDVKLASRGLVVNGQAVDLDSRGRLLANMMPAGDAYQKTFKFKKIAEEVEQRKQISQVNPGDTVVILPLMYTGNLDLFETPAGSMPGGFIVTSIINSTLTGQWLKPVSYSFLFIFIAVFATAILANFLSWALAFTICMAFIPLALASAGTLLFSYGSYIVPWLFPAVSGALTGLFIFYEKSKAAEVRTRQLKLALGHAVPPAMLQEIIRHPELLQMRPTSDIVSVMFIDIVGFSLTSERQDPLVVFSGLKEFNTLVRRLVHEYGGVVDKALGDGVLSYFGHSLYKSRDLCIVNANHAELALQCAIRIQEENIKRCLENGLAGKSVYPLRIGINTASVYIGNLGDDNKIEFTIVGDGVNYAKRLEEGCEMFKILIGQDTKHLLATLNKNFQKLEPRILKIKHHDDPQGEAFEYDPFVRDPHSLATALKAYQESSGFERSSRRWEISEANFIGVKFTRGRGKLTSYAEDGFSMTSDLYFARGVELTLMPSDETLERFSSTNLSHFFPLVVDVRWGRKIGEQQFVHGLHIRSLNKVQKALLFAVFAEAIHPRASAS